MSEKLRGACIFGQSGGPTSVINASAYGVIRTALDAPEITKVYGAANGIVGVLREKLYDLSKEDACELELLMNTPSSELGSSRYKITDDKDLARIHEVFEKYDIRYFFYNGGNDSMDTCQKVSDYLASVGYECRVIGVPKTIDNDLCGTDHCPGFGSAAKYIATTVAEVYKDAHVYDTDMLTIIEIMGRNAGWLTGASALAGLIGMAPDFIYMPELTFDMDTFLRDVIAKYKETGKCIVAVSEGVRYADRSFVSDAKVAAGDGFGHAQLGGTAAVLAASVKNKIMEDAHKLANEGNSGDPDNAPKAKPKASVKVRAIELSLLQRCAAHLASQTDIDEAFGAGKAAVESAISGESGKMIAFARETVDGNYKCNIVLQPLSICANTEKKVPREWMNEAGTGVTQEFIDYVLPLIQGENTRKIENGLPRFAKLKKITI